jgi:hypothetical protein
MKILISEEQHNRLLLENSFVLDEGGRKHYEERKERIQETLNVIFDYGGINNLIQTYGQSIPKLFNPKITTLKKFVKPVEKMALGESYVIGTYTLTDDEYFEILEKLDYLEENFKKVLSKNPGVDYVLNVHDYNINPSKNSKEISNFNRIDFVNPDLEKLIPALMNRSKKARVYIANEGDSPSVGDGVMVMLKYGDLDTLINDRVKDQKTKFSDYRVITFNQFEKEVDKIKKQEEEEERLKADAEAEERAKIDAELNKKIEMEKRREDFEAKVHNLKNKKPELEEPKKKFIRKPNNIEGYFKLLDGGLKKEAIYLYDTFKNAQNEKESIVTKYKNIGKYPSPEMADEIKSLGIGSLRNKIKDVVSSNINYKLRDSFIDMFNTTHSIPTINEEFYYINTEIGVIKLTENQFKTISYLL